MWKFVRFMALDDQEEEVPTHMPVIEVFQEKVSTFSFSGKEIN